jgi:hypothetical protein
MRTWLLPLALLVPFGCGSEDECGERTDAQCPTGQICVLEDSRAICAQPCSTDDDCTDGGRCESCLASGDCPACAVCVTACL